MGKRSPGLARRERDCYDTPAEAVEPLLRHWRECDMEGLRIVEPCAGAGRLCWALVEAGHKIVWASDIEPRHARVQKLSAWDLRESHIAKLKPDVIVTNTPWPSKGSKGEPVLSLARHFMSMRRTWLLLAADFMHNAGAAKLIEHHCSRIVSVGRVRWIEGSAYDGVDNACWYCFEQKLYSGQVTTFFPYHR